MNKSYYWLLAFTLLALVVSLPLWLWEKGFGLGFAGGTESWGHFGSFFSGIVSPVMSTLSVAAIVVTLALHQKSNQAQAEANLNAERARVDNNERTLQVQLVSQFSNACIDVQKISKDEIKNIDSKGSDAELESSYSLLLVAVSCANRLFPVKYDDYPDDLKGVVRAHTEIVIWLINCYTDALRDMSDIKNTSKRVKDTLIKIGAEAEKLSSKLGGK